MFTFLYSEAGVNIFHLISLLLSYYFYGLLKTNLLGILLTFFSWLPLSISISKVFVFN